MSQVLIHTKYLAVTSIAVYAHCQFTSLPQTSNDVIYTSASISRLSNYKLPHTSKQKYATTDCFFCCSLLKCTEY